MSRQAVSTPVASLRRCPNCGTRVAQNAETCYFCGHDLTKVPRTRRRITWIDLAVVVGLLLVVILWWRMAGDNNRSQAGNTPNAAPTVSDSFELPVAGDNPATDATSPAALSTIQTPLTGEIALPDPFVVRHEVQAGETLFGIAARYGITVDELKIANNLSEELIRPGDNLIVPVAEAVAEGDLNETVSSVFKYTVQSGDSIVSIAIRFGAQVETILTANQLDTDDFIRPGQTLIVPVEQVPSAVLTSSEAVRSAPGVSPNATPTVYAAPMLLGPKDTESFPRSETILFSWISVDLLAPNEWYVLRLWPLEGTLTLPPTIWTKATSYRFATDWAPPAGGSARYGWQVTVVRILPDVGDGREIQTASTPSEVRTFTWQ